MGRLNGRTAIVTGAGTGIGRETALLLSKEGATVVVADLAVGPANCTVEMLKRVQWQRHVLETDVSQPEQVRRMVNATVDAFGRLDILVNNAGISVPRGFNHRLR